jgi:uncharacterized membrane-anchored protein
MQLRITPKIGPRYWTAILIASMCGTNAGDFFPDVLKLSTGVGLLILIGLFALIVIADRMTQHGNEAFYWLAILVVRAAATNVADYSIGSMHFSYITVSAALAVLLGILLIMHVNSGPKATTGDLPPTNAFYWFTMLTAGSLGTVIGDGVGHAFSSVQIGVPISAGLATLTFAIILGARSGLKWTTGTAYWVAVVAVRWWGTNFGDMLAFFLSLTVSLVATGAVLALVLIFWRAPLTERGDDGEPITV